MAARTASPDGGREAPAPRPGGAARAHAAHAARRRLRRSRPRTRAAGRRDGRARRGRAARARGLRAASVHAHHVRRAAGARRATDRAQLPLVQRRAQSRAAAVPLGGDVRPGRRPAAPAPGLPGPAHRRDRLLPRRQRPAQAPRGARRGGGGGGGRGDLGALRPGGRRGSAREGAHGPRLQRVLPAHAARQDAREAVAALGPHRRGEVAARAHAAAVRRRGHRPAARFLGRRGLLRALEQRTAAGAGIAVPTLLLHSFDDPFLPPDRVPVRAADENPWIVPAFTDTGGHVGFIHGSPGRPRFWAEEQAARFVATLATASARRKPGSVATS